MIKFESIYKSEYNKILDDFESEKELKEDENYTFNIRVNNNFIGKPTIFSSRTRNKRERFKNELICKK